MDEAHEETGWSRIRSLFSLSGRVALVTGGRQGLGLEIGRILAEAGARVFLSGRQREAVEESAASLAAQGLAVEALALDLTQAANAGEAIRLITARAGRLDILVNNIGVRFRRPVSGTSPDEFSRMVAANLVAPYALAHAAAPLLAASPAGRIINVSSITALRGPPGDVAYTAAKGGLSALTRGLAADLGASGVTVNDIVPGTFATETNAGMVQMGKDNPQLDAARFSSLGRWGRSPEIAGAALLLASDAGAYITGQAIVIDGGLTARIY
jgi:gluconate 5-dehydrogenase